MLWHWLANQIACLSHALRAKNAPVPPARYEVGHDPRGAGVGVAPRAWASADHSGKSPAGGSAARSLAAHAWCAGDASPISTAS